MANANAPNTAAEQEAEPTEEDALAALEAEDHEEDQEDDGCQDTVEVEVDEG